MKFARIISGISCLYEANQNSKNKEENVFKGVKTVFFLIPQQNIRKKREKLYKNPFKI